MVKVPPPDLAGIYITDDSIDVIFGRDLEPEHISLNVMELRLDEEVAPSTRRNSFAVGKNTSIERLFDGVADWLVSEVPNLRAVGVAGYGPFKSLDESNRTSPLYGQVLSASQRIFAGRNLAKLIGNRLEKRLGRKVTIGVTGDVTAAAVGIAYRHGKANALIRKTPRFEDQVFVFVKVSSAIGGAFFRPSTRWASRLHPEMGQMNVPLWPGDADWFPARPSRNWNAGTIDGLASVPAILERYPGQDWETLVSDPTHEAWERQAWYLAHMAWNISSVLSPHQIVMGGKVLAVRGLIERVRERFGHEVSGGTKGLTFLGIKQQNLEGYLQGIPRDEQRGITAVERPGIIGALCLSAMSVQKPALRSFPGKR